MKRLTKDSYFLEIAKATSGRATCSRKSVGCVLVSTDGYIIGTGYNGPPAGLPHEPHKHSTEECTSVHAEKNALAHCDRTRLKGSTAYLTLSPCVPCARALVDAGVTKVVFADTHSSAPISIALLRSLKVIAAYKPHIIFEQV